MPFGQRVTWRVDKDEHRSVEYTLACGRVVGGEVEWGVFEAPPLTRGETFSHSFDDVGSYVVRDAAYGLECAVEADAGAGHGGFDVASKSGCSRSDGREGNASTLARRPVRRSLVQR